MFEQIKNKINEKHKTHFPNKKTLYFVKKKKSINNIVSLHL